MKRWPARMPTCQVLFLLSDAGLFSQSKPRINGHTVVLDSQGKLLSWVARQERAYDHVVKLGWNFILKQSASGVEWASRLSDSLDVRSLHAARYGLAAPSGRALRYVCGLGAGLLRLFGRFDRA